MISEFLEALGLTILSIAIVAALIVGLVYLATPFVEEAARQDMEVCRKNGGTAYATGRNAGCIYSFNKKETQ